MLIGSFEYLCFLAAGIVLFSIIPERVRLYFLLILSLLFYLQSGWFSLLLLSTVSVFFYFMAKISGQKNGKGSRWQFYLAFLVGLVVMFFFRHVRSFFGLSFSPGASFPLGLSFYVFTLLGYLTDVYRGQISPERRLDRYLLFASFFPKISQGPIERARSFLPQIARFPGPIKEDIIEGAKQILLGLFKKTVIADRLGVLVGHVYARPNDFPGLVVFFATVLFAFQIYADFSGYMDMAVGSARFFGIRIHRNFMRPYLAKSIKEFWARWHISLS
jgi:D-alanyl-lipoteichoic acid acyltransferase DltB (MBOAT superfamily)